MVGIVISLLLNLASADGFSTPAPTKLKCWVSGKNIGIGVHYGTCRARGGAEYKLSMTSVGVSLRIDSGFFKLKSIDGPFQDLERIVGNRAGLSVGIGGDVLLGTKLTGNQGRVRGWIAGGGLGFAFDNIAIKLIRTH